MNNIKSQNNLKLLLRLAIDVWLNFPVSTIYFPLNRNNGTKPNTTELRFCVDISVFLDFSKANAGLN